LPQATGSAPLPAPGTTVAGDQVQTRIAGKPDFACANSRRSGQRPFSPKYTEAGG